MTRSLEAIPVASAKPSNEQLCKNEKFNKILFSRCVLKKHEKKNHKNVANKTTNAVTNTAKALYVDCLVLFTYN